MDFDFTEAQVLLRESVARLLERHAPPETVRRLDREGRYPDALYEEAARMGLFQMPFPEAHGGLGGGVVELVIINEEIGRHCFEFQGPFAAGVFCGLTILRAGDEAQKRHWLPRIFSGTMKMAICISEPDAGSDAGRMRTRARRDGDSWVISGEKLWTTGASARDAMLNVYARTDPSAPYREGLSLFLVENDRPGVGVRKLDMLGRRMVGLHQVVFDEVRVPADRLVGGENKGWPAMLGGLQLERVAAAAGYWGGAQAVIELARAHAMERRQFGQPIGGFHAIAHMLAGLHTEADAGRLLTWRAAAKLAAGEDALRETSMAKLFTSETYARLSNLGMQIMGAMGYSMETDMQRHFRDSRSATIGAGTSQMQRNLIAGTLGLKPR